MQELEQACRDVLLDNMPESFRAAIDDLLAKGQTKKQILGFVQPRSGKSLTYCQVRAYLDSKEK